MHLAHAGALMTEGKLRTKIAGIVQVLLELSL